MEEENHNKNQGHLPPRQEIEGRNPDGTMKKGFTANPKGINGVRNPLKSYVRAKFAIMTEAEKDEFLKDISKELKWQMAEGRPPQEITGEDGKPLVPEYNEDRINEIVSKIKMLEDGTKTPA